MEHLPIRYDLPRIYEQACRMTIAKVLAPKFIVLNGREYFTETRRNNLFSEIEEPRLAPDIVVLSGDGRRTVAVADVKYKLQIDSNDYYQLLAYMESFRLDHGAIINLGERNHTTSLHTPNGKEIAVASLDLADVSGALQHLTQGTRSIVIGTA